MPAYSFEDFIDEVTALVAATWTDVVPNGIWEDDEVMRETWEARDFPYCVFELSETRDIERGLVNDAQEWDITFHYIADVTARKSGVRTKLGALRSALWASNYATSQATMLRAREDWTPASRVNNIILSGNGPFISGALTVTYTGGVTFL